MSRASGLTESRHPVHLSSYAEYMLHHAIAKHSPDMPLDAAALIGCGVTTGVGAVIHTAKVQPGETVAVIGCGSIGLSAINGGHCRCRPHHRHRHGAVQAGSAKKFGATDLVNAKEVDPVLAVQEMTQGGVHYSFEAIGLAVSAEQAFRMLRSGTATIIGMIPVGVNIELQCRRRVPCRA